MDYRTLARLLKRKPGNRAIRWELNSIKDFLLSERFSMISNINDSYMLKKIDEFVEGDGKECISVGVF